MRRWLVRKGVLKELRGPTPEEVAANPVFQDPGAKEQGPGYQPQWGATIYADSEVMTPYIGSAQEEKDHIIESKLAARDARKKTGATCPKCFGWGTPETFHVPGLEALEPECTECGGTGSI